MALRKIIKQDEYREIGFGSKVLEPNQRLMNKDGSSNVSRVGLPLGGSLNIYHSLITMPWWKFNILVISAYVVVNLFFATLYYLIDPNDIGGMIYKSEFQRFMEIFYFSAQSLTTVGYGRLNPVGLLDSSIATVESLVGLLGFALATGLLYGRFSRPVAKIAFSKNAIVAPYQGITAIMLRIANKNKSELIDIQASLIASFIVNENGTQTRKFFTLKLELTRINLLSMSWTIVHPIDEESPFFGWDENEFNKKRIEIMVLLQAYEETFAQTVHTRSSYLDGELVYGARFSPMTHTANDGSVRVELNRVHEFSRISLEKELQKMA